MDVKHCDLWLSNKCLCFACCWSRAESCGGKASIISLHLNLSTFSCLWKTVWGWCCYLHLWFSGCGCQTNVWHCDIVVIHSCLGNNSRTKLMGPKYNVMGPKYKQNSLYIIYIYVEWCWYVIMRSLSLDMHQTWWTLLVRIAHWTPSEGPASPCSIHFRVPGMAGWQAMAHDLPWAALGAGPWTFPLAAARHSAHCGKLGLRLEDAPWCLEKHGRDCCGLL